MTKNLKRCPFCGEEARVEKLNLGKEGLFRVICPECLTATHLREEEKNAVAEWNARPIEDALQKELDEAHEDNADNMEYHVAERERLKAENARLREALGKIIDRAEKEESKASNSTYGFAYDIEDIARDALKGWEND